MPGFSHSTPRCRLGIDIGGTFTDFVLVDEASARIKVLKVPSDAGDPNRALPAGLAGLGLPLGAGPRRQDGGQTGGPTHDARAIAFLAHGTTVATNALIQRTGGPAALLTTRGFRDLPAIGRQQRPSLYDLHGEKPPPLVPRERCLEITERMLAGGRVHTPLAEEEVRRAADLLRRKQVKAVAVCFLHSYANHRHEQRAAAILREELGEAVFVCASSELLPEFREYERWSTTILNAYLAAVVGPYLEDFRQYVQGVGMEARPLVSLSNGGLSTVDTARRIPLATALSGPSAGVMAAAWLARHVRTPNLVTLDMGGTSTDVALVLDGAPTETAEREVAGYPVAFPALDIQTVGAGGGSIAWVDSGGLLKVGPHSARADPGPACYGRGGRGATVTDAHMVLGTLGSGGAPGSSLNLNRHLALAAVEQQVASPLGMTVAGAAHGIIQVVTANMVRAIWSISVERGIDPRPFALMAYGGAGPMHAAAVAQALGMEHVLIPPSPGTFSALGLLVEDIRFDLVQTVLQPLDESSIPQINAALARLREQGWEALAEQGVPEESRRLHFSLDLRYAGQDHELTAAWPGRAATMDEESLTTLTDAFHRLHQQTHGYNLPGRPLQVVNVRLKAVGVLAAPDPSLLFPGRDLQDGSSWALTAEAAPPATLPGPQPEPAGRRAVAFDGKEAVDTPIYHRRQLAPGTVLTGPAIIEEATATTVVPPGAALQVDALGIIHIRLGGDGRRGTPDP